MGIETEQIQVTGLHLQQHLTEAVWEWCFPAHAHTCHLVTFVMSFKYLKKKKNVSSTCIIHTSEDILWLLVTSLHCSLSDTNSAAIQIASQQHLRWCTLGFVRSLATDGVMCRALSTRRWIALLMHVLEEDQGSKYIKNINRQVGASSGLCCCLKNISR